MAIMEKLRYGNTNTFFLRGKDGGLLIDTDYAGTMPAFFREIKRHDIKISDITYVMATHYHPDHIGLISSLMDMGIKLLLIDRQADSIHFGDEIFGRDRRLQYKPISGKDAAVISCAESRAFLSAIGIGGKIISTVSHSKDRVSVMLDSGTCIVGDLEPLDYLDAYTDHPVLREDWDLVLSYNPKKILYAHANKKIWDCERFRRGRPYSPVFPRRKSKGSGAAAGWENDPSA